MIVAAQVISAQIRTPKLTVYKQFKPSVITLKDGRKLSQPLTNIFLKNSSLLYMNGTNSMEANMDNVVSVKFDDRLYVKIDTLLCFQVDTIGNDALYCATIIDMPAYVQQLKNNQVISNIGFDFSGGMGGQMSTATIDISTEDDYNFPLIDIFYFRLNGKFVRTHERILERALPKEKRRMLRTFENMEGFSWTDRDSLLKLLKALQ
jgi:hypothetical protein